MPNLPAAKENRNNRNRIRPAPLRKMYAALATSPDAEKFPLIAKHFPGPTRQQLLHKIEAAEVDWRAS